MFTPQRGRAQRVSIAPSYREKGKAVADEPPVPEAAVVIPGVEREDVNDWRRFREAGLLDEATMEWKDRQSLLDKVSRLEKELFDYQYNMGLLLIEKKKWNKMNEEFREAIAESQEVIKREQTAHLIAFSEVEQRQENPKNALDVEKQHVAKLERALREVRSENKQLKLTSETKLADANSLVAGIGDRSRDVEQKMHAAEAKLAVASRKSSEMERKLQEIESRETVLQHERMSLNAEREAQEMTFSKHKEDLQDWERKLQGREESLCEVRRTIIQREEKVNEIERGFKKKEKELEETQNKIDFANLALRKKEDDVNHRFEHLIVKEKVEIQKLLDEHRDVLEAKKKEFNLEMEVKKKSLDEEIDKCRFQSELLLKDREELKLDKKRFEEEWDILDEKRNAINKELSDIFKQKENFEKLRCSEEEKLETQKLSTQEYIKAEMESLRIEKETFNATMRQEQSLLCEKSRNEHTQLVLDFELRKRDLEIELHNRREEMERNIRDREKALEDKEKELSNINYLKEVARKEEEELRSERQRIEKEKLEIAFSKKQLQGDQLEMRNDIDDLRVLSKKLKDQREQFMKERTRFFAYVERLKGCGNCGDIIKNFQPPDLQLFDVADIDASPLSVGEINLEKSPTAGDLKSSSSKGALSWVLQKCLSPIRKSKHEALQSFESSSLVEKMATKDKKMDGPNATVDTEARRQTIADDGTEQPTFDKFNKEVDNGHPLTSDNQSNVQNKIQETPEKSQQSELRSGCRKPIRKSRGPIHRTNSVKAVVEDAAVFLGRTSGPSLNEQLQNDSSYINEESLGDSSHAEKSSGPITRKRHHEQTSMISGSELEADDSEVHSRSVTAGDRRRKRRQTLPPPVQTPGEKRYNLRRPKTTEVATATRVSVDRRKGKEIDDNAAENLEIASAPLPPLGIENGNRRPLGQIASDKGVDILELSSERVVKAQEYIVDGGLKPGNVGGNMGLSEEINGCQEDSGIDENRSLSHENDVDGSDDESELHPGEVSIGKKLWTFFST